MPRQKRRGMPPIGFREKERSCSTRVESSAGDSRLKNSSAKRAVVAAAHLAKADESVAAVSRDRLPANVHSRFEVFGGSMKALSRDGCRGLRLGVSGFCVIS